MTGMMVRQLISSSRLRSIAVSAAALLGVLGGAVSAAAQDQPGVRLEVTYRPDHQPGLVVLPLAASSGADRAANTIRGIIRQDLDFSDRFTINDNLAGIRAGEPVNVRLWKERGADWVVDGAVAARPGGLTFRVTLHDAVYSQVKGEAEFDLPPVGDPGFRMAVHAVADQIVFWATGEPGMAATRIAFVLQGRGSKEVYVVDSDGENLQRLTSDGSIALSPAWSPDGRRIAFTSYRSGIPVLYERDLATNRDRALSDREGLNITPAYSPDGRTVAFAASAGGNTELFTVDRSNGNARQQTRGRGFDSLSPSYSPDGRQVAFVSNRLGEPHIYVMSMGGEPRLVSDYTFGQRGYNTSPEWSPRGDNLVYHSRINGVLQLMLVSARGGTPRLLTNQGTNEDPSWAPDGRHVVFSSRDRDGGGLFVLDVVSGRIRPLLQGRGYGLPAWSPALVRATPRGR
jgi:TolB protein